MRSILYVGLNPIRRSKINVPLCLLGISHSTTFLRQQVKCKWVDFLLNYRDTKRDSSRQLYPLGLGGTYSLPTTLEECTNIGPSCMWGDYTVSKGAQGAP